jgi:hypothetical protein
VFVSGQCGLHGPDWEHEKCKDNLDVEKLQQGYTGGLIDDSWATVKGEHIPHHENPPRGGGGWSDPRDFALCRVIGGKKGNGRNGGKK